MSYSEEHAGDSKTCQFGIRRPRKEFYHLRRKATNDSDLRSLGANQMQKINVKSNENSDEMRITEIPAPKYQELLSLVIGRKR